MLFLFNDFPVLKTFSSYIAIFELEMCQIYTNLGFDITNEAAMKIRYEKSLCGHMLSFFLGKYLFVECLNHMVGAWLTLLKVPTLGIAKLFHYSYTNLYSYQQSRTM